jgi:hypothetical protein
MMRSTSWYHTPLLIACVRGDFAIVKLLVEHNADLTVTNFGRTPLATACEFSNCQMVEYLIQHGADTDVDNKTGRYSPLCAAIFLVQARAVHILLTKGLVNANAIGPGNSSALEVACESVRAAEMATPSKASALLHIIEMLLYYGADPNTPIAKATKLDGLSWAAREDSHMCPASRHMAALVFKMLLRNGASPDAMLTKRHPDIGPVQEVAVWDFALREKDWTDTDTIFLT